MLHWKRLLTQLLAKQVSICPSRYSNGFFFRPQNFIDRYNIGRWVVCIHFCVINIAPAAAAA